MAHVVTLAGLLVGLAAGAGAAVVAWRHGLRAAMAVMAVTLVGGGVLAWLSGFLVDGDRVARLALTGGALWLLLSGTVFYGLCLGLALRGWSRWRRRSKSP